MRSPNALYARGNNHFRGSEPYGLTIGGRTVVIVRDTTDLAAVWKNITTLSYDPFVARVLLTFGISKASVERMLLPDPGNVIDAKGQGQCLMLNSNPQQKCYLHLQSDWLKRQLLPGTRLDSLQTCYQKHLREVLDLNRFFTNIDFLPLAAIANAQKRTVSLRNFTRSVLSHCALKAFFGKELFDVTPNFAKLYQKWEDDSWKVFFGYPRFLANDLHAAKREAVNALTKYYKLPLESRPKMSWLMGTLDQELRHLGLDETDRSGVIMMIVWATNNNAHHICFWMLSHMLCDPSLLNSIRSEIDACFTQYNTYDVNKLLTDCPHLNSIWQETLRFYNASTTIRTAMRDCYIGGKLIHSGDQIFGPARLYHLETSIFGDSALGFDAQRFLTNKHLPRSKGFMPFGGGHTYCPGRYFAQREIYMLLAETLRRFELEVTDSEGTVVSDPLVPPVETSLPAAAAIGPAEDVFVTLSQRIVEV